MLYVPERFLFIHIPRTAGNAISRTILDAMIWNESPVACLQGPEYGPRLWHRHSRAIELYHLPDFDRIRKFAVDRPYREIVHSDFELHKHIELKLLPLESWHHKDHLIREGESLEAFENRRWKPWLAGKTVWEHWCCDESGRDLGVTRIDYHQLQAQWPMICDMIGADVSFPIKDDWQKQQYDDLRERGSTAGGQG